MEIDVICEDGVFKPLQKVDLKEGTRITLVGFTERDKEQLLGLARRFTGIGGHKESIDSEKLHQIEEDMYR